MDKKFERRLEKAKNPRMRKHNRKPSFAKKIIRPSSHVEAFLQELSDDYHHAPDSGPIFTGNPGRDGINLTVPMVAPIAVAEGLAVAAVADGVDKIKEIAARKAKREALERRRKYYEADAARREAQREIVRAAMPGPANRCPTPAELTDAYLHRRDSAESIERFGTLMIDLEEYAKRVYDITGNKFTGSTGGVKDWLKQHCPLLAKHYSTCQRYKRMAQDDKSLTV